MYAPCARGPRGTRLPMLLSELRGQNPAIRALERALASGPSAQRLPVRGAERRRQAARRAGAGQGPHCARRTRARAAAAARCARASTRATTRTCACSRRATRATATCRSRPLRSEILPVAKFAPFEAEQRVPDLPGGRRVVSRCSTRRPPTRCSRRSRSRGRACTSCCSSERPDRLLVDDSLALPARALRRAAAAGARAHPRDRGRAQRSAGTRRIALARGRADRALALAEDGLAKHLLEQAHARRRALERGDAGPPARALRGARQERRPAAGARDAGALLPRRGRAARSGSTPHQLCFRSAQRADRRSAQARSAPAAPPRAWSAWPSCPSCSARNANPQITLDHAASC